MDCRHVARGQMQPFHGDAAHSDIISTAGDSQETSNQLEERVVAAVKLAALTG